jgi:hypothetical protein
MKHSILTFSTEYNKETKCSRDVSRVSTTLEKDRRCTPRDSKSYQESLNVQTKTNRSLLTNIYLTPHNRWNGRSPCFAIGKSLMFHGDRNETFYTNFFYGIQQRNKMFKGRFKSIYNPRKVLFSKKDYFVRPW